MDAERMDGEAIFAAIARLDTKVRVAQIFSMSRPRSLAEDSKKLQNAVQKIEQIAPRSRPILHHQSRSSRSRALELRSYKTIFCTIS